MGSYIAGPKLTKDLGIYPVQAKSFSGYEPYKLKIKIVIWQNLVFLCNKALDIVHLAATLVGSSHSAADILTDPTGIDLIAIGGEIKLHSYLPHIKAN